MSLPAPVVFALCHNASTLVCMCTHVPIDNIRTAQSPYTLFQVESKVFLGTHHHSQGRAFFSTEAALCNNNYYFKIK